MRIIGSDLHAAQQTIAMLDRVETRRQKHDRRDTALLLELLTEDRVPATWRPPSELCDLQALLRHRDQWVRIRARVKNALQGLALAHGVRRGAGLWTREGQATLAALSLAPRAGHRRSGLQALNDHLTEHIDALDRAYKPHRAAADAGAPRQELRVIDLIA